MKAAALAILFAGLPLVALAEAPALSAEAFERLVEGKTFDTHDQTGRYGVETFLPGRRAIWRDADRCLEGRWRAEGAMICFDYIGEPLPFCWTYHDQGGWMTAYLEGDPGTEPITLYPSEDVVTCDGFLGV
ncbi:MAG: hypothetical protein B7Z31_03785 [Rhodobacterales bacterium 12-65-15]|nr:MAG: hypothetical protein B7Z31_03785 [Rhodobacterales bacterium 12-65-15]